MTVRKRTRLWINSELQGAVIRRCLYYWFACIVFLTLPLLLGHVFTEPNKLFWEHFGAVGRRYWPVYVGLCGLLPFLLSDAVRFTHRIAGPIYRVQSEMNELIAGKEAGRIKFRENDFWQDMAVQFNRVAELIQEASGDTKSVRANG